MAFEGMGRNPHDRRSNPKALHRKKVSTAELEDIRAKLDLWNRVMRTPVGESLQALVKPTMDRLIRVSLSTTHELLAQGYPVESHEVLRAEARGAYWEWHAILHEPMELLNRLSEIEGEENLPSEAPDSDDLIEP